MLTLNQLREKRSEISAQIKKILDCIDAEKREVTQEEDAKLTELQAQFDDVHAQVVSREKIEGLRSRIDAPYQSTPNDNKAVVATMRQEDDKAWESFDRRLALGPRTRVFRTIDGRPDQRAAYTSGMYLLAAANNRAAQRWCENNMPEYRTLVEGTDALGGYLVPDEFATTVIELREQYGVFRRFARVWPMASDLALIPRVVGSTTAYYVAEGAAITESDMSFDQIQLSTKTLAILTAVSLQLNEDSIVSLADYLARDMARQLAYQEDLAGFNGDGTSTYGNIQGLTYKLRAAGGLAGAVDAATNNDTWGELTLADYESVVAKLPEYAGIQPRWFISKTGYWLSMARLMYAAGGNSVEMVGGGAPRSFLGIPVEFSQVMLAGTSTTDHSDKAMALLGDLSMSSTLGDRRGFSLAVSTDYGFNKALTYYRALQRYDIVNHDVGDATNAGACVALVGE